MSTTRVLWAHSRFLAALTLVLSLHSSSLAQLTHRYNFATNGNDQVGTAHWTATGATFAGGQVHFDGINDFLSMVTNPMPTGSGASATIEFWGTFDPNTPVGSRVFDFTTADGDRYQYFTARSATNFPEWKYDDNFDTELGPANHGSPANIGQQVAFTLVFDPTTVTPQGTGQLRLYRNGIFVAADHAFSVPILSELAGTTSHRLGHGQSLPETLTATQPAFLKGSLNEFRIYNTALSQSQILSNSVAGPDVTSVSFTDKTWNAGSSSWNTAGNWTANGVPQTANRAVIGNGGTANVTAASPEVGSLLITNGTLAVSGAGSVDVKYPITLGNTSTVNVTGGGSLGLSGVVPQNSIGTKTLHVDNGTLRASSGSVLLDDGVNVNIGAGGAVIDSQGGTISISAELIGAGDITVNGGSVRVRDPSTDLQGSQNPNYSGTWHVSNSIIDIQGSHGALGTGNAHGSKLDISDSTLVINTAIIADTEYKRVPVDINASGNVELINTAGFDNTFRMHGSLSGNGTIHYTVPFCPTPIGIDFESRDNPSDPLNPIVINHSGFTGRFIVDDDSATRFRTPTTDLPNAIFEMAGDGAWTAKRGSDINPIIQLGGLAGVGPNPQLQIDSGGVTGFGSRLEASIDGQNDPNGLANVTYEIGGASQDAEYFGIIRDSPFVGGQDVVTVVKVGNNTQAFSGRNSYSGTTTVNGGTLLINGTHAQAVLDPNDFAADPANYDGAAVGNYTVNAGGTLGGTGTIGSATDLVDVNVLGGALAPGAGTLTVNGNYSQNASSTLKIEIAGNPASGMFDLLDISGTATLAGMLDVSLLGSPSLAVNDEFTILTASSVTGGASLSLIGSAASSFMINASSGNSLKLKYLGATVVDVDLDNDGDVDGFDFLIIQRTNPALIPEWDLQYGTQPLTAGLNTIPEPSAILLACCGFAFLMKRNREVGTI